METTKDWNTYVSAHVFTDRSMNRLLECGVKAFDHGFFMSEKTMKKIYEVDRLPNYLGDRLAVGR